MSLNRTATRTPYAFVLKVSQRFAYAECVVRTPEGPIEPAFQVTSNGLPSNPSKHKMRQSDIPACAATGTAFAKRLLEEGIEEAHWIRQKGQTYHGRIKAFVDAIREQGVKLA